MTRKEALEAVKEPYAIEDEKVINLCIKRLGITREQFDEYLKLPPKNFWDYPNSYTKMRLGKIPVWVLSRFGFFTKVFYEKYFNLPYK